MTVTVADKRAASRKLHEQGCFVIPNPWDVSSGRMLQSLGFKALATTSSGFAWSQGRADGQASRDMVLEHLRVMAAATDLPLNADFESGYATTPDGVAESVRMAVATGVSGLSIEDSTGDPQNPLRDIDTSVARLRAARAAIDKAGGDTLLVGRAENFIVGRPDLDDTLARLRAYSPAPIASTLRASAPGSRLPRSWQRSRRSPSTWSSDRRANSRCMTSRPWACGA